MPPAAASIAAATLDASPEGASIAVAFRWLLLGSNGFLFGLRCSLLRFNACLAQPLTFDCDVFFAPFFFAVAVVFAALAAAFFCAVAAFFCAAIAFFCAAIAFFSFAAIAFFSSATFFAFACSAFFIAAFVACLRTPSSLVSDAVFITLPADIASSSASPHLALPHLAPLHPALHTAAPRGKDEVSGPPHPGEG
jgi:hypothetical protein